MRDVLAITKALADRNRLRILCVLQGGELCVCQIIELLELAPSTVSKHLSILANARLIDARKDGRWIWYGLAQAGANAAVRDALAWVAEALDGDAAIVQDAKRLRQILAITPEDLCQKQARGEKCCSSVRGIPVAAKWRKGSPAR